MGRSEQEAELARILANVQGKERKRLRAALGEPPNLDNVPADFWQQYSHGLRKEIVPAMEKIFMASAEALLAKTPSLGVDWALVNTQASEWASKYGFDLVSGITDATRTALQEKVAGYYENGLTMPQFIESLEPLFGPVRAEMIAVTETTRAAVQGQAGLVNELNKTGVVMTPTFITSEDETVCPICSPLNGKKVSEAEFPPLHPRCRCDIAYKFDK